MWSAAICGSSGLAVKAPGCLIVTPGRDVVAGRQNRLIGSTRSSRCNNKTARGSLPHSIVRELEIDDYNAKKLLISVLEIKGFCLRYALCEPHDL